MIESGKAFEKAVCFGWICGQMQHIGDRGYKKISLLTKERQAVNEIMTEKQEE